MRTTNDQTTSTLKDVRPPRGRGRTLEQSRQIPYEFLFWAVVTVGTCTFLWLMLFGGLSWSVPDGWLAVVVVVPAVAWYGRTGFRDRAARIAAGADWLRVGRWWWVDLYRLVRVTSRGPITDRSIVLVDDAGRRVTVATHFLHRNPALHDLVTNGVRHSWHRGARVDQYVQLEFDLFDGPAWRWFEPGRPSGGRPRVPHWLERAIGRRAADGDAG